ncbi:MAG: metal-dependent hydrolase [Archaeoglobaceae archaeon]
MRHTTHILFGTLFAIPIVSYLSLDPAKASFIIFTALIGSLLPDVDHPKSYINRKSWGIFYRVVLQSTHRGWMHSLFGAFIFTLISTLVFFYLCWDMLYSMVFLFGYLSHLLADSLNPTGVNWLWPKKKKYKIAIIKTGSKGEVIFQAFLVILLALMLTELPK